MECVGRHTRCTAGRRPGLLQISNWPPPRACRRSGRLFEVSTACGGLTDATLAEVAQYLRLLASCSQEVAGGAAAAAPRAAPQPTAHRSEPPGDSSPAAAAREGTLRDGERPPAAVSDAEMRAGSGSSAAAPSEEAGPASDGTVLAQTHRARPQSDTLPAGAHAVC